MSTARERAEFWDTLRRSLADRANAFSIYMSQLAAANGRGDDGFSRALEMCQLYGELLREQVENDWREETTEDARYESIKQHLKHFVTCERWIDRRFARGIQTGVPRALKTIARDQLEAHGLVDHEAVLTVGPPDSFETHQSSLFDYLFDDFHLADSNERLEHLRKPTLSIISVPYIEGTTTLWHPITLGHEIAHLRIDAMRGLAPRRNLMQSLLARPEVARLIEEGARDRMYKMPSEILNRWVDELLCDLNAVRLFGPAGLSAVAEFVGVLGSARASVEVPTDSHPALSLRLKVMRRFLERDGDQNTLPYHARVWGYHHTNVNKAATSGPGVDEKTTRVFTDLLGFPECVDDLIDHVCDWDPPHRSPVQPEAVRWVRDRLLDGIPGGTHFRDTAGEWKTVGIADVVNGAWAARDAFEPEAASGDEGEGGSRGGLLAELPDRWMPEHEKRRRVDILASKAVDSVELARLWARRNGDAPGIISPDDERLNRFLGSREGPDAEAEAQAGVLSGAPIVRRLRDTRPERASSRLVVTPLFANSVHEAGIDVRLGPEFIVFRHSRSAVFDPLAEQRDPRMLQESVQMGWGERFFLHPKELVLAATLEYIVLPGDVAAQVVTRSSYGRLGLTTATAVQVQPGSRGCITLELVNHGDTPIALSPGMRVGQLMLFAVPESSVPEFRRYWFPVGPEFSKVDDDRDAGALIRLGEEAGRIGGRGEVPFVFRGGRSDVESFVELLSKTAQARVGNGINTRDVENSEVSGHAPASDLARALRRFMGGTYGIRVMPQHHDGGEVRLLFSPSSENGGGASFHGLDGEQVEMLPGGSEDGLLSDAIARFRARRHGEPPLRASPGSGES